MITPEVFRTLIFKLPDVVEVPHFDRAAFKANNRIFVSLAPDGLSINIKFTLVEQSVFCAFDRTVIHPVANKWGTSTTSGNLKGWTTINLTKVKQSTLKDALQTAYNTFLQLKKK